MFCSWRLYRSQCDVHACVSLCVLVRVGVSACVDVCSLCESMFCFRGPYARSLASFTSAPAPPLRLLRSTLPPLEYIPTMCLPSLR